MGPHETKSFAPKYFGICPKAMKWGGHLGTGPKSPLQYVFCGRGGHLGVWPCEAVYESDVHKLPMVCTRVSLRLFSKRKKGHGIPPHAESHGRGVDAVGQKAASGTSEEDSRTLTSNPPTPHHTLSARCLQGPQHMLRWFIPRIR